MNTFAAPDLAVLIGRFQPFHHGHLVLLRSALSLAPRVAVVLGSAHHARTPRNPWTWQERAEMIQASLTAEERARTTLLPQRDLYNPARWASAVEASIQALSPQPQRVLLLGHEKDSSSEYLHAFPHWQQHLVPRQADIDATALRQRLWASRAEQLPDTLQALSADLPQGSQALLHAWAGGAQWLALQAEWQSLQAYAKAWSVVPYPPVFVTVDAVVRCADHLLLIRRGQHPGLGLLALPGGFIDLHETALQSALRELEEETRLSDTRLMSALRGSQVFDHPARSQRGRTITHAFYFDLGEVERPTIEAADDAQSAQWISLGELAALEDQFHDDHFHIIQHFLAGSNQGL
ncbi:MAG: NUDIX domain-containing protein [Ideonella sp.]|nr:NUDIX domain-containing protein [Ideonella sp.]